MCVPGQGFRTYVGLGEESTYGTAVARDEFYNVNSAGFRPTHQPIKSASLQSIGLLNSRVQKGSMAYAGEVALEAQYEGIERWLKHALGTVATTVVEGGTRWKHAFTIADDLPTGLTMELFKDSTNFVGDDQDKAFLMKGCKITSLELSAAIDAYLMATFGIVAQDEDRVAKEATPTFETPLLVPFTEGVLKVDGLPTLVPEFSLSIGQGLDTEKRRLGRRTIVQPRRGAGKVQVTGSFRADFDGFVSYDRFRASTAIGLDLTFTGPTLGGGTYVAQIEIPKVRITEWGVTPEDESQLEQTFSFEADRSSLTASEVTISITNGKSSV